MLKINRNKANNNNEDAIKSFFETTALSDLCTWLYFEETKDGALYQTTEGIGFIYQVSIPPFFGESFETYFKQIFRITYPKNTLVQFFSYASANVRSYVQAYRDYHAYMPDVDHPDLIQEFMTQRAEFVSKAALNGFWPGIRFRPRIFYNLISVLVPYDAFHGEMDDTLRVARDLRGNLHGVLKGVNLHPENFGANKLATLLREIFNLDMDGNAVCNDNSEIRRQVIGNNTRYSIVEDSSYDTDLRVKQNGGEKYIRTFTISGYPRKMNLWEFNNILFSWDNREIAPPLSAPFAWSLSVKIADWKITKAKLTAKTAENIRQADKNALAKYIPRIAKKAEESRYVAHLLEENAIPLPSYFTLFVTEKSRADLNYASRVAISKLSQHGFNFEREKSQNMIAAFLESLPLNHIHERDTFLNRRTTLFDANLASMVPLIADVTGSGTPDEMYIGRKGGIAFFHRYDSDTNFNLSIVAESGGGKSFNTSNRHIHALASGRQVRVIDIGRSYEYLCREIGGEYVQLTEEKNPCFNFFTNILETPTGDIYPDELDSIVPMVGFLAGLDISQQVAAEGQDNLSARYASIIIRAITTAYNKKRKQAGLRDIADAFLEISKDYSVGDQSPEKLYESIWPYSHGPYAQYFNGENNIHYSKDYVVLELEEIAQRDTRLKTAIVFSIIIQMMREIFLLWSERGRRTDVDIDEAWMLFKLSVASEFMESASRRFRKYGSSLCVITQGIDDAYKNRTTKAIWENSAHKIFLKMKNASIDQAINESKLTMNGFEKEWFKTLSTYPGRFSELFFDSGQMYGVSRLVTDNFSYGFFTTTSDEKRKIKQIAEALNTDIASALRHMTRQKSLADVLLEQKAITPLLAELALQRHHETGYLKSMEEIFLDVGVPESTVKEALKKTEVQQTWEEIFKT